MATPDGKKMQPGVAVELAVRWANILLQMMEEVDERVGSYIISSLNSTRRCLLGRA
jgi:hypothetical protein